MTRVSLYLAAFSVSLLDGGEIPDFRRDVQPIFEKYCQSCHGDGARMGGFEYRTYEDVMRGTRQGGPLIEPGKSKDSRLYRMLTGKAEPAMPLDKRYLSSAELRVIRHWINAGAKPPSLAIKPPKDELKQIYSMALSPDGNSFALGRSSYIDFIVPGTQLSALLVGQTDAEVRGLEFSADGRYLAAAGGELRVWNVLQHRPVLTKPGSFEAVAIAPDGRSVATSGKDQCVVLWDVVSGRELRSLDSSGVNALRFSPDGRRLITGEADGKIRVWDALTGAALYQMTSSSGVVSALAVSPDGKWIAAGGMDHSIRVWPMGELVPSHVIHEDSGITRLAWSQDGARLAWSSENRSVKVYQRSDWSESVSWTGQSDQVSGLEFTYDDHALAIARRDGTFERRPLAPVTAVYSKREP